MKVALRTSILVLAAATATTSPAQNPAEVQRQYEERARQQREKDREDQRRAEERRNWEALEEQERRRAADDQRQGTWQRPGSSSPPSVSSGSGVGDVVVGVGAILGGLWLLDKIFSGDQARGEASLHEKARGVFANCATVLGNGRFMKQSRASAKRRQEICSCVASRATRLFTSDELDQFSKPTDIPWGAWLAVKQPRVSRVVEPCAATVAEQQDLAYISDLTLDKSHEGDVWPRSATLKVDNRCSSSRILYLRSHPRVTPMGIFATPNAIITLQIPVMDSDQGTLAAVVSQRRPTTDSATNDGPIAYDATWARDGIQDQKARVFSMYPSFPVVLRQEAAGTYALGPLTCKEPTEIGTDVRNVGPLQRNLLQTSTGPRDGVYPLAAGTNSRLLRPSDFDLVWDPERPSWLYIRHAPQSSADFGQYVKAEFQSSESSIVLTDRQGKRHDLGGRINAVMREKLERVSSILLIAVDKGQPMGGFEIDFVYR